MSFGKHRLPKDPAATAGPYLARSLAISAGAMAAIDLVVALGFQGTPGRWAILIAVELGLMALLLAVRRAQLRRALSPLDTVVQAAEQNKEAVLQRNELRRLSRRLKGVDASALDARVAATSAGAPVEALTGSINEMLERIDQGYRAQARFTSDASHELRTPIAVIQGYADLLDRWGKEDPETMQEAIDAIRQEADSMANLVEQLLYLVRGDKGTQRIEMVSVDLSALAAAVARETAMVAPGYIVTPEIQTEITAEADAEAVKECLRVLTDNAVKYTPEGGTITVGLTREEGFARLSVTDTGIGISPEDQAHIFERFYRADASRARQTGGTGLGLSIADWIARRHHGRIEVESTPGQGSTFTLVLPLEQPEDQDA